MATSRASCKAGRDSCCFGKGTELFLLMVQINLPVNRPIAEIYHIHTYPSLHLFINGDDEHYNDVLNVE